MAFAIYTNSNKAAELKEIQKDSERRLAALEKMMERTDVQGNRD